MTTQITVEALSPITHNQIPVITTELLAQLYCTEINNIKVNYTRNAERFTEGKHFFKVVGDELKNLRVTLSNSQTPVSPKARPLILWTERGAARHAKMLETDQAWDVFEKLEDCYFGANSPGIKPKPSCSYDTRTICYKRNGTTINELPLGDDDLVINLESWVQLAQKNNWIVIRREDLARKLTSIVEQCLIAH